MHTADEPEALPCSTVSESKHYRHTQVLHSRLEAKAPAGRTRIFLNSSFPAAARLCGLPDVPPGLPMRAGNALREFSAAGFRAAGAGAAFLSLTLTQPPIVGPARAGAAAPPSAGKAG